MPENPSPLKAKISRFMEQFPYLSRTLGLIWQAAPNLTLAWLGMVLVSGLLPAATVWLIRPLVNAITEAVAAGGEWHAVQPVIWLGLAMAGVVLAGELLRSTRTWISTAQSERVEEHISRLIHDQSVSLDLSFYDVPAYYDHLHRARHEAGHRPMALLENLGSLMQNVITLGAMAGLLLPYGWWLPVVLLISTLPALYVVLNHTLRHHAWRMKITADERRTWYLDWLLTSRETASELRLFGLGPMLQKAYQKLRKRLRQERLRLIRNQALAGLGASAAGFFAAGAAMAWMGWRTLQGHAGLGDLALFYQAFNRGQGLMRGLLEGLAQIFGNSIFIRDLFAFLELQPEITDPPGRGESQSLTDHPSQTSHQPTQMRHSSKQNQPNQLEQQADKPEPVQQPKGVKSPQGAAIQFHDVDFNYPGGTRPILSCLNLEIPPGRIDALLGANGEGKSTLVKLLCRFYDPVSGRVEIDGEDLRDLPLSKARARVSALFQSPVHYSATVARNIGLGRDAAAVPQMRAAAAAAGAEPVIHRLPHGYDSLLGTWFKGGTDLSVGEWQRLSMARAFMKPSPVLVLDEPTSAMDPWAETTWLQGLRRVSEGRTVLLVTHRLTTAMAADVIHVMAGGQVVESGTHKQLIVGGGAYAELWRGTGT
jgi:ATP-binding cassette subfamily B protein